ncbi:MAG: hypothetical protein DI598_02375 [Pseudopedobacter saltans]|uniref:Uncharacterized protein n=1 Tax=Pseudopedobacter saltans TaxID=151895 RepID=A0A2W5FDR8_9SPHI|nr:MAG: hypothetical protein DI598_02375 [Pseudopedobacter saltans]
MNVISTIVSKTVIQDFYKKNTWWLLLLFLAAFGLVQNPILLHKELMLYIQSNTKISLLFAFTIFIYSINVVAFQNNVFQKAENRFVLNLSLLSKSKQLALSTTIQLSLLSPIITYSLSTISIGIIHSCYFNALLVLIVTIVSVIICTYSCLRNIHGYFLNIFPKINISISKKFVFFLWNYIWISQRKKLIWIKIVSLLILSIPVVRNNDDFQLSDFNIFWAASMSANLIILYDIFVFFNTDLRFIRQMPIPFYIFFLQILLTVIGIMLPECLLIWFYRESITGITWYQYSVYSIGTLILLYNVQWDKRNDFSNFMGIGAILLIGLVFLAAYKIYLLLGLGCLTLGLALFSTNYYSYQFENDKTKD